MTGTPRSTTQQTQEAARRLVASFGITNLDSMTGDARRSILVGLYKQLQADQSIAYDTARRHIAQACRRLRGESIPPDGWGGKRRSPGSARQRKPNAGPACPQRHPPAHAANP